MDYESGLLIKDNLEHSSSAEKDAYIRRKAQVREYLGKTVTIEIDRPVGYVHNKENYKLEYSINYGYVPGVIGGDGEELDVYLLGVNIPIERYTCRVIGIIHRHNDVEDKLAAAPMDASFTASEIADAVRFQEKYYTSEVETETERVLI